MNGEHVLVGLGYDDEGRPELEWAAREAQAMDVALQVLRVYDPSEIAEPWLPSVDRMITDDLREDAREALEAALMHVRSYWTDVHVSGTVVEGDPAEMLIAASRSTAMTVVGGRQLSVLGAAVLGSVSAEVAARAAGPVVVVGQHAGDPTDGRAVVVGVDGAADTDEVLGFAFEHAARHDRPVHAVYCWNRKQRDGGEPPERERAEFWLAEEVAAWRAKHPKIEVITTVIEDHPVAGLVTAAGGGAELLVVGNHSRRRRLPARLGSVSQGVLHHAHCPVAVVHPRDAVTVSGSRRP